MSIWERAQKVVERSNPVAARGVVTDLTGLIIEGNGPAVGVGTTCTVMQGDKEILAQVVGFRKEKILLMPYGDLHGIAPGAAIISRGERTVTLASNELLGRVFDPMGRALDGKGDLTEGVEVPVYGTPPSPLERSRIENPFDTGIKTVNSLLTIGRGQRVGVMAGSGVGKSTFLGMVARHSKSDVNVIVLVGERGREVREFIERDLGPEGMARSVIIVATSDKSPLLRIRAAFVATAVAEYFRDQGAEVCLMLDSITRFCMAQREIGLAVGEPPSASGYTPSVFALLPKLLERAGTKLGAGSITAFYTVLVEGDDMNEPIADAVRGILDGHIILSRNLAGKGQYPAIDILQSISRLMPDLSEEKEMQMASVVRTILSDYADAEDLITIGAYKEGQNPRVDRAVRYYDRVVGFLKQRPDECFSIADSWQNLGVALEMNEATQ